MTLWPALKKKKKKKIWFPICFSNFNPNRSDLWHEPTTMCDRAVVQSPDLLSHIITVTILYPYSLNDIKCIRHKHPKDKRSFRTSDSGSRHLTAAHFCFWRCHYSTFCLSVDKQVFFYSFGKGLYCIIPFFIFIFSPIIVETWLIF